MRTTVKEWRIRIGFLAVSLLVGFVPRRRYGARLLSAQ